MTHYFQYLKYVCRHIRFVRKACFACGLYKQGLLHDLSKFLPSEFFPYANFFYGSKRGKFGDRSEEVKARFEKAWQKHYHRNPHHWEYWVTYNGDADIVTEMPEQYVREMLCDWWGAGMSITGHVDVIDWYEKNRSRINLHPKTREKVEAYLLLFDRFTDIRSIHFPVDITDARRYYEREVEKRKARTVK